MHDLSTVLNQQAKYTYNKNTKLYSYIDNQQITDNRDNKYLLSDNLLSANSVRTDINSKRVEMLADKLISTCNIDAKWRKYVLKAVWSLPENIIAGIIELAPKARNPERYAMASIKSELAKRGA